jgi:hypothetical protein
MRISILQYIKSENISLENEISKLKADGEINIRIAQFFSNSPDFKRLEQEIVRKQDEIKQTNNPMPKQQLIEELESLEEMKTAFQVQVLNMAITFQKFVSPSDRILKIIELFELGEFIKADKMLSEVELSNNQLELLIQIEYLEQMSKLKNPSF